MNLQRIQGPGIAVKFLEVVWLGRICVVPKAVTEKLQAFPTSKYLKEVQFLVGIWGSSENLYPI